jgi:Flp pilus assembly protein TadD
MRRRLSMSHSSADPLFAALAQHRAGHIPTAEQLYRQVVADNPTRAEAWDCLGVLCMQTDRQAEAVEHFVRAIQLAPTNPEFYNHLGAAYGGLKQHDEAVATLRRAVQLAPQSGSAHYNLGTALRNAGKLEDAVTSFRHAVAASPNASEAHYNLANTLRELKRFDEAVASYRNALAARPDYVKALINLGNVLRELKQFDEALSVLRRAIELQPDHANALQNLGTALRDTGQFVEAVGHLRRAATLEPESAETQNNLGTSLQAMGDFDGAIVCYRRALELDPELPDAHFSMATWQLRAGNLERGFAEYEWRWKCSGWSDRGFKQPRWDGSPLNGRTILLYAEQGLGDTLHFVRYAREAHRRGGHVIVECQAPLVKLLSRADGVDRVIALGGQTLPEFDVHAPLLSMPTILGETLDSLTRDASTATPYLNPDAALVERWRDGITEYHGLKVGICWQGNPQYLFDAQRSFPLSALAPLARVDGVRLISLQKNPGAEQIAGTDLEVIELDPPLDEASAPFMDTAAVMTHLDLVVTTDTAIAHLAGGLGVPVWTAVSAHPDWRWMFDHEDTPWYPTMRLFRQTHLNDWGPVMQRMAEELSRLSPRG